MKLQAVIGVLVLFSLTLSGFGQNRPDNSALEIPGTADFDISPGRYFSASTANGKPQPKRPTLTSSVLSDISEAMGKISQAHVSGSKLKVEAVAASSIKEMLRALDPHSRFYTSREYSDLLGEHNSEYSGTGMTIAEYGCGNSLGVFVISVTPRTSAAKAGLRFGDKLVSVNGRPMTALSAASVRELVRGPQGTSVQVEIERVGHAKTSIVSLRRERIERSTVNNAFMLSGSVGYIALNDGFGFTTAAEFASSMSELKAQRMESLVLDLRGNGGGIFDQAVEIAEHFLPAGAVIVSQAGRGPGDKQTWRSTNQTPENLPVVVLVDGVTASASEILAGALQDNDRALIVGERTFGKGLVQNVYNLENGTGVALTAARYYTPSGRSIQRDYSDIGLYEYFQHAEKADLIDRSATAVKTLTNRTVYGGDGIAPDVKVEPARLDKASAEILDAAFFFVRDRLASRPDDLRNEISRRIDNGEEIVDPQVISELENRHLATTLKGRQAEVRDRLGQTLVLATLGFDASERVRIMSDPAVTASIDCLPQALRLARSAYEAWANKNARRVTSPTGTIGRNRRN